MTGRSTARDVANMVEAMYRARAVGDVTDIAYVIDVPGQDGGSGTGGAILDDVSRLDRDLVLQLYDKGGRHGELADRAAAVMACNCNDVELLGYSPFPFMRYRCGGRRGESISYILSLTSGMACRLCGRCRDASGG